MTTIWIKPKLTLDFILTNCPKQYVTLLLVLGGISASVANIHIDSAAHRTFAIILIFPAIIFGGLIGFIFYHIYAFLLEWTGRWINGKANHDHLVFVIAWSLVPQICSLILLIFKFLIFEDKTYSIDVTELNQTALVLYYTIETINSIFGIWSLIILVIGISLVQKFNIWTSILNIVLTVLVIIVPIWVFIAVLYIIR